jgi:acetylglutamate kinase
MRMALGESDIGALRAKAASLAGKYSGAAIVVKYGGAAMAAEDLRDAVALDVAVLASLGLRVVLVHGGGPEIDAMLRRLGKEPVFVQGLRYTDAETMEVVQMVLAGKVSKELARLIGRAGGRALGICGLDGGMLQAERLSKAGPDGAALDLGLVGDIKKVDVAPLEAAFAAGYVPVVATVAGGIGTDPNSYNVNADTAAAEIAVALGARELLLLTDVPGLLADVKDPSSLIRELPRSGIEALKREGVLSKGMIPKVDCLARAVDGGVGRARIVDGRAPHAVLAALLGEGGTGTTIV